MGVIYAQSAAAGGSGKLLKIDVAATQNVAAFKVITSTGENASSANVFHKGIIAGVTLAAINTGFVGKVVTEGLVVNPAWAWNPGDVLYLNGTSISTTPPTSGFRVIVGIGTYIPTTMYVKISESILL